MPVKRFKPAIGILLLLMLVVTTTFFAFPLSAYNRSVPYKQEDHGNSEEEWAPHDSVSGWWYLTGMLHEVENPDHLYAYQYTVFHLSVPMTRHSYIYSLTLIDLQTGQRLTEIKLNPADESGTYANENMVSFLPWSTLLRDDNRLNLWAEGTGMRLDLVIDMGKGAIWHGDNGVIVMSCPRMPQARTVYYSYTNMPTSGTMTFLDRNDEERSLEVDGQSWFDRQWGPLGIEYGGIFWEWFSLRFFDNEEVMLFSFPRSGHQDATYVDVDGNSQTFRNFTYTTEEVWQNSMNQTFSWVWDLIMPGIKDEHYRIVPMIDKLVDEKLELGLWMEIPAEILNEYDELVGYAFVELVNGARDEKEDLCPGEDSVDSNQVTISGSVSMADGTPLCALVLANGHYALSCDPVGEYTLDVPLDANDEIKLFGFTYGWAPFEVTLTSEDASSFDIIMEPASPDVAEMNVTADLETSPLKPEWVTISGRITTEGGRPLCALMLANGRHMFSCHPVGEFILDVPLDANGEITLFGFCSGRKPFRQVLKPNQSLPVQ
jgi:predicted secreted hydrolase